MNSAPRNLKKGQDKEVFEIQRQDQDTDLRIAHKRCGSEDPEQVHQAKFVEAYLNENKDISPDRVSPERGSRDRGSRERGSSIKTKVIDARVFEVKPKMNQSPVKIVIQDSKDRERQEHVEANDQSILSVHEDQLRKHTDNQDQESAP